MDDDSALLALGKQFEEIADEVQKLHNSASTVPLELIEATLGRLEPIEAAIMAAPARIIAGLGVKARHAAYVLSEYWNRPIDRIDWDARAVRLLIEAVCKSAGTPLPFPGAPDPRAVMRSAQVGAHSGIRCEAASSKAFGRRLGHWCLAQRSDPLTRRGRAPTALLRASVEPIAGKASSDLQP
jgi:hypothetical protein